MPSDSASESNLGELPTTILTVDSSDALDSTNLAVWGTPDHPIVTFDWPISNIRGIRLLEAQIPMTFYAIGSSNQGEDNRFVVLIEANGDGTVHSYFKQATIIINPGTYTGAALATAIQTLLNAVGAATTNQAGLFTTVGTSGSYIFDVVNVGTKHPLPNWWVAMDGTNYVTTSYTVTYNATTNNMTFAQTVVGRFGACNTNHSGGIGNWQITRFLLRSSDIRSGEFFETVLAVNLEGPGVQLDSSPIGYNLYPGTRTDMGPALPYTTLFFGVRSVTGAPASPLTSSVTPLSVLNLSGQNYMVLRSNLGSITAGHYFSSRDPADGTALEDIPITSNVDGSIMYYANPNAQVLPCTSQPLTRFEFWFTMGNGLPTSEVNFNGQAFWLKFLIKTDVRPEYMSGGNYRRTT
jgi:hypothetical protein